MPPGFSVATSRAHQLRLACMAIGTDAPWKGPGRSSTADGSPAQSPLCAQLQTTTQFGVGTARGSSAYQLKSRTRCALRGCVAEHCIISGGRIETRCCRSFSARGTHHRHAIGTSSATAGVHLASQLISWCRSAPTRAFCLCAAAGGALGAATQRRIRSLFCPFGCASWIANGRAVCGRGWQARSGPSIMGVGCARAQAAGCVAGVQAGSGGRAKRRSPVPLLELINQV